MRAAADSSRLKVIVVGPCDSGKSTISNVLAEAAEGPSEVYRPTFAARILECEVETQSRAQRTTVELWDVSGDNKFNKTWPAVKKDAVGVVLVYNPENQNHEAEIDEWFTKFPRAMGMTPNQVLVIQAPRRADGARRTPMPAKISAAGVNQLAAVQSDDLVRVRQIFSSFLETVRQSVLDKQRQEEEDVMKGG